MLLEQAADPELAPLPQSLGAPHLVRAPTEATAGGKHVQARVLGRPDHVGQRLLFEQQVGQAGIRDARGEEAERGVARRVGVDDQHALVELHQRRRQVDRRRALADAPLCVGHRDTSHDHPPPPPRGPGPRRRLNPGYTRGYRLELGLLLSWPLGPDRSWFPGPHFPWSL